MIDWQTMLSLMIVLAAAFVIIRKLFGTLRTSGAPSCGSSCSSCPASSTDHRGPSFVPLVQLDNAEID